MTDEFEEDQILGREVIFKASYWSFQDKKDDNSLSVFVGGKTAEQKSVQLKIEGYRPSIYLELPTHISGEFVVWKSRRLKRLVDYFMAVFKDCAPNDDYEAVIKYKLHYKTKIKALKLSFNTFAALKKFSKFVGSRSITIEGLGTILPGQLIAHEQNLDPIITLTNEQKIKLAGWISARETIAEGEEELTEEDRCFSTCDISIVCHYTNVKPYTPTSFTPIDVKYMCFDIETYSKNHNSKNPDPMGNENVAFHIGYVSGILGRKNTRKRVLITLGNPLPIKGVEIVRCKTEKQVLLCFRDHINRESPDCFLGYNIMKFDWNYLLKRSENKQNACQTQFLAFSKLLTDNAKIRTQEWESKAYGKQVFSNPDAEGITQVDLLLEVERNYKLPNYRLDTVAEKFLGEHKDDLSARQLFLFYQFTEVMTPMVDFLPDGVIDKPNRIYLKETVQRILPLRKSFGMVRKLRSDFIAAKTGQQFKRLVRKAFFLTGKYCIKDCELTVDLAEKLNIWHTMEALSNCTNVPMSYLHTRGQQIKVVAQVKRNSDDEDFIIPYNVKGDASQKLQGAIVFEADPGDYDNVLCFDFESLYPSCVIHHNMCWTTLLKPNDPTPDSECNCIPISTHEYCGCPKDTKLGKKKPKNAKVSCRDQIHRFRKVIHEPDGTRKNEGVLPRMLRALLSERKIVKKVMAKYQARLKMHNGLAEEEDIKFWRKLGWEIIEPGSLSEAEVAFLEVAITIENANQLALKVSANSAYGILGAVTGMLPCPEAAESVTALARVLITAAINFIVNIKCKELDIEGKRVYGDTDSAMITFLGKTTAESFKLGEVLSKETTWYLRCLTLNIPSDKMFTDSKGNSYRIDKTPDDISDFSDEDKIVIHQYRSDPINLQFENLYGRYFILTKKRYIAYAVNQKGEIVDKIKKGVVLARRDNCKYLRNTFEVLSSAILDRKNEYEIMNHLYDRVHALFTRQIKDVDLVIYVGVKDVMTYAKKTDVVVNGETHAVYLDEDNKPISNVKSASDPRLIYRNLPQSLLALKMIRRGDDVPPNTRLEFLYLEKEDWSHQGEKAEDYTYYQENKRVEDLRPDRFHYVNKQLVKPITELLKVKFPRTRIRYRPLPERITWLCERLNDLQRNRVKNTFTFEKRWECKCDECLKERSEKTGYTGYTGWSAWKRKGLKYPKRSGVWVKNSTTHSGSLPKERKAVFKGDDAKVAYILDSMKRYANGFKQEIDGKVHRELKNACLIYRSRQILQALDKKYGLPKRQFKYPRGRTYYMTTRELKDESGNLHPEKTFVKVISTEKRFLPLDPRSRAKKPKHYYIYRVSLEKDEKVVFNDLPADALASWSERDGTPVADMLEYRLNFRLVIDHLNTIGGKGLIPSEILALGKPEVKKQKLKIAAKRVPKKKDYESLLVEE